MEAQQQSPPRKNPLLFWIGAVVIMAILYAAFSNGAKTPHLPNNELLDKVAAGEIERVVLTGNVATAVDKSNRVTTTVMSGDLPELLRLVREKNIPYAAQNPPDTSGWMNILFLVAMIGFPLLLLTRMSKGISNHLGGPMQMGQNRAKQFKPETGPKKTFEDVIGMDETIDDVGDYVQFLKDPAEYQKMGARMPRGLLLTGQPGCGKTLLAKAIAGEAGVPFFSISGSDFVEMLVGVGASRVRSLFAEANKHGKAIIFIDEIDAVGRHRGAGLGGGHDEREQTLNQLLVEMDGFDARTGIVVIAATNRPDVLDPALLRPGRFDRQASVPAPDRDSREKILRLYAKGKPMAPDADFTLLAKATQGLTGAGLEALMNEAAVLATRTKAEAITTAHLQAGLDKTVMGSERRNILLTPFERQLTAGHEIGHAMLAYLNPEADPPRKVSIIPRGRSLGVTAMMQEEDRHAMTTRQLHARIQVLYGGLVAEELMLGGDHTTGPSDDLKRLTELAVTMVTKLGFGINEDANRTFNDSTGSLRPIYGGGDMGGRDHGGNSANVIDTKVFELLRQQKAAAKRLLTDNHAAWLELSRLLLEKETIEAGDIERVLGPRPASTPRLPLDAMA